MTNVCVKHNWFRTDAECADCVAERSEVHTGMGSKNDNIRNELADIKRRLGPYTRGSDTRPYTLNDAELARLMQRLIAVVEKLF
jgi:hypothetical protein